MLGFGFGFGLGRQVGGVSILPQTQSYIDAVIAAGGSIPPSVNITAMDTLIGTLIDNGVYAKLSGLYVAGYDYISSLVNVVNPAIVATLVNSLPTANYTSNTGWVGAESKAINLKINLSTDAKYSAGGGSMFAFLTQPLTADSGANYMLGSRASLTSKVNICGYHTSLVESTPHIIAPQYVNNTAIGTPYTMTTDAMKSGLFSTTEASGKAEISKNGGRLGQITLDGYGVEKIVNVEAYALGVNNANTSIVGACLSGKYGAFGIGAGLTTAVSGACDTLAIYTALDAYFVSLGVTPVWR